jgi:hypothetical protein
MVARRSVEMIHLNCKSDTHVTRSCYHSHHATPSVQGATRQRRCMSAGICTVPAGVWCSWTATSGSHTNLQVP